MTKELSSAQLKQLRALGRSCPALAQIGKGGVTDALAQRVNELLAQRELVKVRVLDAAPEDRHESAEKMATATKSALVAVVGRTALLYKPNPKLEPEKRIELPG